MTGNLSRNFLFFQALLWTTYAVVHFLASIPAVQPNELQPLLIMQIVRGATGLAITSLLAPFVARAGRSMLRHALQALAAAFAWMMLDRIVLVSLAPFVATARIPWNTVPRGLDLEYLFVILAWMAGYAGLQTMRRNAALEARLQQQQLEAQAARGQALSAQLNAHFLFNTLNMIRSLIADNPAVARDMVMRMSNLLRRVLSTDGEEYSTLEEELTFIDDYLAIQKARFGDSLHTSVDVDAAARAVLLPKLILQPLVENAFKYGRPDANEVRSIEIRAKLEAMSLMVSVSNTGVLQSGAQDGAGTRLTTSRLARMYGAQQKFELAQGNGWVRATITIDNPRVADQKR